METLNSRMVNKQNRPIKVLQFGEGNFLRAFVDYMFDIANEKGMFNGSIVLVKPIEFGNLNRFKEQDYQYTVSLRGIVDGKETVINRIVTSVADAVGAVEDYQKYVEYGLADTLRFIVSNTTEAGIVYDEKDCFESEPPRTYPGKLTKLMYLRYKKFSGAADKGLIILPVELIDDNGIHLKECVLRFAKLWKLGDGFEEWLQESCVFCSTLVDRIVTGYPHDEAEKMCQNFGYKDNLLVTAEPFGLWVIESDKDIQDEMPLDKAGLPVVFTDNQKPYKQRKVRILNGAHTAFVPASFLCGNDYVRESMEDELIRRFTEDIIYKEVIPTLTLPKEDLLNFAGAVVDRFHNPYIKHALLSISLNSVSKWRTRCMPSFLGYSKAMGVLPKNLTFSLAALIAFYKRGEEMREGVLIGKRDGKEYQIMDDAAVLEFFLMNREKSNTELTKAFMSNLTFFGQDLTKEPNASATVARYLDEIEKVGMRKAMENL